MATHAVALQCMDRGVRCDKARRDLVEALGGQRVPEPDEGGIFEVEIEAGDFDAALQRAWNAVAAAGADDHLVFAEHPSIPEHWRRRGGGDGLPGALV